MRTFSVGIFLLLVGLAPGQSFERLVALEQKVAGMEERLAALEGKAKGASNQSVASPAPRCYVNAYGQTVCVPAIGTVNTVNAGFNIPAPIYTSYGNTVRFNGDGSTTEIEHHFVPVYRAGPIRRLMGWY